MDGQSLANQIDLANYNKMDEDQTSDELLFARQRGNQMRVQTLLRQLVLADGPHSTLDTLRLLRRTLRELHYRISWLTQVDLFATLERLLREETNETIPIGADWQLINDSSQLLAEALTRLPFELESRSLERIFSSVVQNLGNQRSEVRRSSLLLLNQFINERRQHFPQILKIFIDYGVANYRNREAQKGAVLSLPLLMTEQAVAGEDLGPLVRALTSELLADSNSRLFYSIYLALQRLHLVLGDHQFGRYLRTCQPEAVVLYKQAASRNNSLAGNTLVAPADELQEPNLDDNQAAQLNGEKVDFSALPPAPSSANSPNSGSLEQTKQVKFEGKQNLQETQYQEDEDNEQESQVKSKSANIEHSQMSSGTQEPDWAEWEEPSDGGSRSSSEWSKRPKQQRQDKGGRRMSTSQWSVSSTCSSQANLVDPAHYMNAAALDGRPLSGFEQHLAAATMATTTMMTATKQETLAIDDLTGCNTPTVEQVASNELRFGIFPRHLVSAALSAHDPSDKMNALNEMMCIIRDSPVNHLAILVTYFDAFLDQFLGRLIKPETDPKLELIGVDMIETIAIKTKVSTMNYVRPMVALLVRALADQRSVFLRENSVRVLHKMMAYLPPQYVIDALFEHKHSSSALVREEALDRTTAAVLEYDPKEFNLTKLCYHTLPMLADHSASVRLAALECISSLAHALGPARIGSLLTAAEAVQTGCDYDGLLDAIHARLLRRTLPRVNPDGSIRHVIKPFLSAANANFHQEQQAADVRWILDAPSSHQHQHQSHQLVSSGVPLAPSPVVESPQHHQQHHRLGVYSPPSVRQRRSSLAANLAHLTHQDSAATAHDSTEHHHHHHHHHDHHKANGGHNEPLEGAPTKQRQLHSHSVNKSSCSHADCQSAPTEISNDKNSSGGGGSKSAAAKQQAANENKSENTHLNKRQTASKLSKFHHKQQTGQTTTDNNDTSLDVESEELLNSSLSRQSRRQSVNTDKQARSLEPRARRSNSQDSTSSSDTNKILFQYYLSKFKESLRENYQNGVSHSVLPSDSIIYTDTAQAYSLSRHQSRQQQTSFDYDTNSGRDPISSRSNVRQSKQQNNDSSVNNNLIKLSGQVYEDYSSVSSESPMTVMENSEEISRRHQRQQQQQQQQRQTLNDENNENALVGRKIVSMKQASGGDNDDDEQQNKVATHLRQTNSSELTAAVSAPRRRSISEKHQSVAFEPSKRQSVSQHESGDGETSNNQRHSHEFKADDELADRRAKRDSRPTLESEHLAHVSGTRRQKAANLVRQSASVGPDLENHSGYDERQDPMRDDERQGEQEAGVNKPDERQESISSTYTNSDSHSNGSSNKSQREFSEHSTQTSATHKRDSTRSREGRRRSSRRRSSSTRRRESQLLPGESAIEQQADETGELELRRRASKSQPPTTNRQHRHTQQAHPLARANSRPHLINTEAIGSSRRAVSVSPSVANSQVNIRHILENVAQVEGPFQEPQLAFKVAMDALEGACWSTKVEGILALVRLCAFHQAIILAHLHEVVNRIATETRNLRSTVARSAIFALGDLCFKLKRSVEPELEAIVQSLLQKSIENTAFIRDDIKRALSLLVDSVTHWRLAISLIHHGSNHKNVQVRRMSSQFIAALVERMGAAKCLVGARDISAQLIPAAAKFAQDSSPHTRYYGRLIFSRIMQHGAFERLLRKQLAPNMYRSTVGIIESVRRRGAGEPPADTTNPRLDPQ